MKKITREIQRDREEKQQKQEIERDRKKERGIHRERRDSKAKRYRHRRRHRPWEPAGLGGAHPVAPGRRVAEVVKALAAIAVAVVHVCTN